MLLGFLLNSVESDFLIIAQEEIKLKAHLRRWMHLSIGDSIKSGGHEGLHQPSKGELKTALLGRLVIEQFCVLTVTVVT